MLSSYCSRARLELLETSKWCFLFIQGDFWGKVKIGSQTAQHCSQQVNIGMLTIEHKHDNFFKHLMMIDLLTHS